MLTIFESLSQLVKINRVHIDGSVFRLHYRVTVSLLIAFSVVCTAYQYVGKPIECVHSENLPINVINTFCWIHSTYSMPAAFSQEVGKKVPYPGIDNSSNDVGERKYHKYYQWVCFALFFQAVLFYVPRWLWKNWESGKIQTLRMDLNVSLLPDKMRREKTRLLCEYLWSSRHMHNGWAARYFLCELLSLVNVVGQLFLMDRFFDHEFLTYGIRVIQFMESEQSDRVDPMINIFPRMAKCRFYLFGPSGTIQKMDTLCVLPLNAVNEKIYIFLWFWFIIVGLLTTLVVLFRLLTFCCARLRVFLLDARFRTKDVRLDLVDLVGGSNVGDWFLFYMLAKNVDTIIFKELITVHAARIRNEVRSEAKLSV